MGHESAPARGTISILYCGTDRHKQRGINARPDVGDISIIKHSGQYSDDGGGHIGGLRHAGESTGRNIPVIHNAYGTMSHLSVRGGCICLWQCYVSPSILK